MATPLGVELFTAVAGPLRLLDAKLKPIGPAEKEKAAETTTKIERELRGFLAGKVREQGEEPPERDYFATLELLASLPVTEGPGGLPAYGDADRRATLTAEAGDPSLALQYLQQCDKVITFLNEALPRERWATLTGEEAVEPSRLEQSRFWRAWEIAEDPLVVLRDLREGIVVDDQVEVMKKLWPLTYAEMTSKLLDLMSEYKAKNPKWDVDYSKERQVETFLQISRLDPDLVAQLQSRARAVEANAQRERSAGGGQAGLDGDAGRLQTSTQRVAQR